MSATYAPIRNTTTSKVSVPTAQQLLDEGAADTLCIKATMSYNGTVTRTVEERIDLAELVSGGKTVDFHDFG